MTSKAAIIAPLLFLVCVPASLPFAYVPPGTAAAQAPQAPAAPTDGQQTVRVFEGKSLVINTPDVLKRVSVTNDQVATAIVVSPNQVLIHGLKAGAVSLLLWNDREQIQPFELQVMPIIFDLEPLRATLARVMPGENVEISQSGSSVVLTGVVSSTAAVDQAAAVVKTEVPNVVNLLSTTKMDKVVLLEVKFAEVDRNASLQLGANILSTGALNTPGSISTQQFSPPAATSLTSAIGTPLKGFSSDFRLTDMLNVFVFRPDLNLGLMVKALQQKGLLQILAEPNLLALGGKEASFLAGGEYPIPIIQGSTGTPTVTVQFKEFGVRLKFVATPTQDGNISLRVNPEVSSLDFGNAVTLSGFLIPALTTRRADTEVLLRDGQSFAIAGLMDNRLTKVANKIPWLSDVPFLGKLFQSTEFRKSNSELLVMVTPKLVKPLEPGQTHPLPGFPAPFLDTGKFDDKEHPPSKGAQLP
jgi:pilus assembly protein CpaC